MKSIIEEASSIVKAIEAAWIRAEKPQEFSVKIFEEPEKNFFGMVTKSAKIALIFNHVEKRQPKDAGSKHKPAHESPIFNTQTKDYRKEPRRESTLRGEQREEREYQDRREPREPRENRERREPRERQEREPREARDRYENRDQERREPRENREPRERQERQEMREPREQREPRERHERREQREPREAREHREPRDQERREPREHREPMVRELSRKESAPRPAPAHEQEQLSFVAHDATNQGEQQQAAPEKIFWTEEMIATTRAWVETLLKNMNCSDVTFNLEPKRYYLTIAFDKPVRSTKALEQQLFRSCAYLIMQMLRTKMKKQYRGLKVVLSSPTPAEPAA